MSEAATKIVSSVPEPIELEQGFKACLVTSSSLLAQRLVEYLGDEHIRIKHRLADLIGERECRAFIVDTKINDFDLWPAPLLLEPSSVFKSWLFLVTRLNEAPVLATLPSDCTFFEKRVDTPQRLAAFLQRRFDPQSRKRIDRVAYLREARTFVVQMQNGRSYALRVADLPDADPSEITRCAPGSSRHYFRVRQESGNSFEIPWDAVLYHCEPEYEYYKGKQEAQAGDRAARIGNKVREWRTRKGLTITELAERAGLKRPNLSRLEHGQHVPSLETLERIADALAVPISSLVATGTSW